MSDFLERGLECEGCHDEAEVQKCVPRYALERARQAQHLLGNEESTGREGRDDVTERCLLQQRSERCGGSGGCCWLQTVDVAA